MKLKSIIESTFKPAGYPAHNSNDARSQSGPRYFEVQDGFTVYTGGNFTTRSKPMTVQPGDEVHVLPGGNFIIRDGKIVADGFTFLDDPDASEGLHHEYRNGPSQFNSRRINKLVDNENMFPIPRENAAKVKYRT